MAFEAATYEIDPLTLTTPKARLEYLRDFLRRLPPERFNLSIYAGRNDVDDFAVDLADCGTQACICGWTVSKFGLECDFDDEEIAGEALGLDREASFDLFIPSIDRSAATNQQAADVLDHLIRTGEVDWSVARKAEAV